MRQLMLSAMLLLLSVALTDCAPVKLPKQSAYTLGALKPVKIPEQAKTRQIITLATPTASPGFQTVDMVYMMTPFELKAFTRNRWIAPPAQMLVPIMVQALRAKGYYKAVVPPPLIAQSNYRLDLSLLRLQQEFLLPISNIRLEIQAILLDSVTNHVIGSKRFAAVVPAKTSTPYGGVLAANLAVVDLTNRIATWCVSQAR